MKLRNKKTGEIGYLIVGKGSDHYIVTNDEWESCGNYGSLAELTEEWEDYEEPKKYWYIGDRGEIFPEIVENPGHIWHQARKEIGNYFETEEEAEKAVEKLKALKRLRDKGLKFERPYTMHDHIKYDVDTVTGELKVDRALREDREIRADLDLLFGGGE